MYHSTLGLRVIKKKKKKVEGFGHYPSSCSRRSHSTWCSTRTGAADASSGLYLPYRKVDIRLPGKRNLN